MRVRLILLAAVAIGISAGLMSPVRSAGTTIRIDAKRFDYTPHEVRLKLNEPVVLELSSSDRLHGFAISELGFRADVEAGEPVRVPFTPTRAGTFRFLCDTFCGGGHDEMEGRLVVE